MKVLKGFHGRSAGQVSVLGADPVGAGDDWHNRVGICPAGISPRAWLRLRGHLRLYVGYHTHPCGIDETMDSLPWNEKPTCPLGGCQAASAVGLIACEGTPHAWRPRSDAVTISFIRRSGVASTKRYAHLQAWAEGNGNGLVVHGKEKVYGSSP